MNNKTFLFALLISWNFCFVSIDLISQQIVINEVMSSNVLTTSDFDGESSDWIELYNNGLTSVNLQGFYLSDDDDDLMKWEFPDLELPSGGYRLIWASAKDTVYENGEIHTNFKIKAAGENIFLLSSDGLSIIDDCQEYSLPADISLGRKPGSGSDWFLFNEPTPNQENTTDAFEEFTNPPAFSHTRGFYSDPVNLELIPSDNGDNIYYTLNGEEPTPESSLYTGPITIDETTAVRVKVYRESALPMLVYTHTYFFEDDLNMNVISLVTSPDNFWDTTGIYQDYFSGEEKPIHIEYFEMDGTIGFYLDGGVKIHAPDNRSQKSLRLYAKKRYGTDEINHTIFDDKTIETFKCLILRNGGNDGTELDKTQIRDPFVHNIYHQINSDYAYAAYRPVHAYINGDYWGIYNLRERQDAQYIKDNFGYNEDEIDMLEYDVSEPDDKKTIAGDWNDFNDLEDFIINNDMAVSSSYQIMENWIDIENFIDYQSTEIFIGNQDWCNNNVKFWRPRAPGHKWKWILWDTEFGLGTYRNFPVGSPDYDFVNLAFTHGGWGNGDHTWLLRNLADNSGFRYKFISRFLDLLNTVFHPDHTTEQFDKVRDGIASEIPKQHERWGSDAETWQDDLEYTRNFLTERPYYIRKHLAEYFEYGNETVTIDLNVSDPEHGQIKINSLLLDETTAGIDPNPYPWHGVYFSNIPLEIEARPNTGYQFSHWEDTFTSTEISLTILLPSNTSLTAVFVPEDIVLDRQHSDTLLKLQLYPVPAKNHLNVSISNPGSEELNIQIMDMLGQILYNEKIEPDEEYFSTLDMQKFASGIYTFVTKSPTGRTVTKKFLVE